MRRRGDISSAEAETDTPCSGRTGADPREASAGAEPVRFGEAVRGGRKAG